MKIDPNCRERHHAYTTYNRFKSNSQILYSLNRASDIYIHIYFYICVCVCVSYRTSRSVGWCYYFIKLATVVGLINLF